MVLEYIQLLNTICVSISLISDVLGAFAFLRNKTWYKNLIQYTQRDIYAEYLRANPYYNWKSYKTWGKSNITNETKIRIIQNAIAIVYVLELILVEG